MAFFNKNKGKKYKDNGENLDPDIKRIKRNHWIVDMTLDGNRVILDDNFLGFLDASIAKDEYLKDYRIKNRTNELTKKLAEDIENGRYEKLLLDVPEKHRKLVADVANKLQLKLVNYNSLKDVLPEPIFAVIPVIAQAQEKWETEAMYRERVYPNRYEVAIYE